MLNAESVRPDAWPQLYPVPAFVADRLGLFVRVHEATRRAVVYVGSTVDGSFNPVGTGFAAGVKYRDTSFFFFVTADHVVDLVQGQDIYVRMNLRSGDAGPPIRLPKKAKIPNLDRKLDLAIFPVPPLYDTYDSDYVLLDRNEYTAMLRDIWQPGLGDEVAVVGLYTSHHGHTKNILIVRVGHIAMMPDEPVMSTRGYVQAYLVEVRSIVGLSGSPVYITVPPTRTDKGKLEILEGLGAICIGMMLGYHLVASAEDQIIVPQRQPATSRQGMPTDPQQDYSLDERNTGFGVVLPIERMLDIMESEPVRKKMDEAIDRPQRNTRVRPAGARFGQPDPAVPNGEANPNHLEDFTRLVDVAARKRPQGG